MPSARRWWLVRHGATIWNESGRIQGHLDSQLSPAGARQSSAAAVMVAAAHAGHTPAVYASDLARAAVLGADVGSRIGVSPATLTDLRERCFGAWEGRTWDELIAAGEPVEAYRSDPFTGIPRGGESFDDLWRRVGRAARRIDAEADGDVVVVAHSGSLRVLIGLLGGKGVEGCRGYPLDNASVSVVETGPEHGTVIMLNSTDHLRALGEGQFHAVPGVRG